MAFLGKPLFAEEPFSLLPYWIESVAGFLSLRGHCDFSNLRRSSPQGSSIVLGQIWMNEESEGSLWSGWGRRWDPGPLEGVGSVIHR